jgi:hypothetical protein
MAKWTVANLTCSAVIYQRGQPPHAIRRVDTVTLGFRVRAAAELHKGLGTVNPADGVEE